MAQKLGKIEKPAAREFKKGRRLFYIPLIFGSKESPEDYRKKVEKYWAETKEQIRALEEKIGNVSKIYHELISSPGKEGLKTIEKIAAGSCEIAKDKIEKGAKLEAVEDKDILAEFMDWNNCLGSGLQSPEVFKRLYQFYLEADAKRKEVIAKRIDETLEADEIGILFLGEEQKITFPEGVEIFYIAPPALEDIKRWLRELKPESLSKQKRQRGRGKTRQKK